MIRLFVLLPALLVAGPEVRAQNLLPTIDMHLHASTADANGSPPLGLCVDAARSLRLSDEDIARHHGSQESIR